MATNESIFRAVGRGGFNDVNDQKTISKLLSGISREQGGTRPDRIPISPIPNNLNSDLVSAIERFQRLHFKGFSDGRVDPFGNTLAQMNNLCSFPPAPPVGKQIQQAVGKPPARNEPSDTEIVIDLLSRVQLADGGPEEELFMAPFPGMASPSVVRAIERFQTKQFGSTDSRVDPLGATIRKLNQLTNNGTSPKRTLKHIEILSGDVGKAPARNAPSDMAKVAGLLSGIPVSEGGAGRVLSLPVLPGQIPRDLIDAIEVFQRRHFQGWSDGIVNKNGKTIHLMMQKFPVR